MLEQLGSPPPPGLTPLVASGEDIAEGRVVLPHEQLDAMWLKESVHHRGRPGAHPSRTGRPARAPVAGCWS